MIKTMSVALPAIFLTASLVGNIGSAWLLSGIFTPARFDQSGHSRLSIDATTALSSPIVYLIALAALAEFMKFIIARRGERIWRTSTFQGAAFALPSWLACMTYCTLLPLLTLTLIPGPPISGPFLTILGAAWVFIQLISGLLPGIAWSVAPLPATAHDAGPKAPRLPSKLNAAPAILAPNAAASADEFFKVLAHFAELPEGSQIAQRGRIDCDGEIVTTQGALATLVGQTKPTVRRWLQNLEQRQHIKISATGKETRIRLQRRAHTHNGDARH